MTCRPRARAPRAAGSTVAVASAYRVPSNQRYGDIEYRHLEQQVTARAKAT